MPAAQIDTSTPQFCTTFVNSLATAAEIVKEVCGRSDGQWYVPFGDGNRLFFTDEQCQDLIGNLWCVLLRGATGYSDPEGVLSDINKDPLMAMCMAALVNKQKERNHDVLNEARMTDDGGPAI